MIVTGYGALCHSTYAITTGASYFLRMFRIYQCPGFKLCRSADNIRGSRHNTYWQIARIMPQAEIIRDSNIIYDRRTVL
jgi:hypothetical protein